MDGEQLPRWPPLTLLPIHVFKQSSHAPASLLLGIYPECLTAYHRETGTPVSVLLFTTAEKLPVYVSSPNKWILFCCKEETHENLRTGGVLKCNVK